MCTKTCHFYVDSHLIFLHSLTNSCCSGHLFTWILIFFSEGPFTKEISVYSSLICDTVFQLTYNNPGLSTLFMDVFYCKP